MKIKITKAEYDALNDLVKAEYVQDGDNFKLKLDDYEEPGELRRALDRERQEKKEAKERAEKLQREKDEAAANAARNTGDIATLEKSWKEKRDTDVAAEKARADKHKKALEKVLVDSVAEALANKLTKVPKVLKPLLKARLAVDMQDDEPVTRVLDKDGKISALSVGDLEREFLADPELADILIGSKASGSGAAGNRGAGGAKKLSDMNDAERTEYFQRDPAGFNREVAEQNRNGS